MKRAVKILRKILVVSFIVILLLAGLAIGLSSVYEDEVKDFVISKIEQKFSADIQVEKIELNFWRKFPNASLRFQNISVKDSHLAENPPILVARDLFLQFDIYDLLNHNYILKKVEAKAGKIDILIYKSGNNNFHLLNEESDTSSASDFFFSMEDFKLVDMDFSYENQSTLQSYNIDLEDIKLPFEMTSEGFKCGIKGGVTMESYRSEGVEIINNRALRINAGLTYTEANRKLIFTQSSLNVQGVELTLKGSFKLAKTTLTDLSIEIQKVDINKLKPLLPSSVITWLDEYSVTGILKFKASVFGELGGKSMPKIDAVFSMKNASLSSSDAGLMLNNMAFEGSFSNGKQKSLESSALKISSFSGVLNSEKFNGKIQIRNFKNTLITADFSSDINMAALKKIARLEAFDVFEGEMATQLTLSLRFNHFLEKPVLTAYDYRGKLHFNNAKIKLKIQKVGFSEINGNVSFTKNQISFGAISLETLGSKLTVKARIVNYLNMVIPVNNQPYFVNADLVGDNISYNNLMQIIDIESNEGPSNPWVAKINFFVNQFSWEDAVFNDFRGEFNYSDNQWSVKNASADFEEGKISGNIHYQPVNQRSKFTYHGNYKQLNITKVFKTFHNFDQSTLTSENISGFASGSFSGKMMFDAQSEFIPSSLQLQSTISIENGRLLGVDELNALSDYTKIDDFSDIRFSKLSNNITIANEKIVIPKMHISSDKMDMDVFGTHNFKNEYNYHFDILLADILGKKINKTQENEFGIIEDDGYGKTRIYLNLVGNSEDFEVKYDKKEASNKVKEDIKQEGVQLKTVIRQEFTNSRRDSIRRAKKAAKQAEKQRLIDEENGKFIIEWDEDDTTDVDY